MRKILGILNIVAGASILVLLIWLWAHGKFSVEFRALFLLVTVTSLTSGIIVLKGTQRILAILAAVNLIFAGFMIIGEVYGVLLTLFPT